MLKPIALTNKRVSGILIDVVCFWVCKYDPGCTLLLMFPGSSNVILMDNINYIYQIGPMDTQNGILKGRLKESSSVENT